MKKHLPKMETDQDVKNLLEQDLSNLDRKQAKEILQRAKKRAQSNVSKSVDELWTDFNQVKDQIVSGLLL